MGLIMAKTEYLALHNSNKTYAGVWLNNWFYPFGSGIYYLLPGTEEDTDNEGHPIKLSRQKRPLSVQGVSLAALKNVTHQDCVLYCPVAEFVMPANGAALGAEIQDDHHYMWINLGAVPPQSRLALPLANGTTTYIQFS
ncbi:hypothetical protein PQ472_05260 [Lacticaseibacillus pabuli]|uniref:Uncharacterized protein n=1 Tax=Lacticaseibacillus pabuli TaxID=3025672 RepID=A0ABY7WXB1_9LACO|nr:hypothetical protein [Lacticaseibacillus sp. KACC 23028]WDF83646.1 hypothetical protein PQ472_05260 [Lacticaseibacillus sp. KACC 23028]